MNYDGKRSFSFREGIVSDPLVLLLPALFHSVLTAFAAHIFELWLNTPLYLCDSVLNSCKMIIFRIKVEGGGGKKTLLQWQNV